MVHQALKTCSQGYGTVEVGGPAMCFNAQKNWSLEWYDDRMLGLDHRDLPWGGTLSTFVDYDTTQEGDYVVIRLGGRENHDSLFLQYNRRKGINSGTAEFASTYECNIFRCCDTI